MTQSSTPDYARAKTVGLADIPVIDLAGTDSPAGRAVVAAALAVSMLPLFYGYTVRLICMAVGKAKPAG